MGRFSLNGRDVKKAIKRTVYGLVSTAASLIVLYPNATEHIVDRILPMSIASGAAQAIITLAKNFVDDHSKKEL